jgi:hypothetical protein
MSMHRLIPIPFSSFDSTTIRNELENGSGVVQIKKNPSFDEITDPQSWYKDLCKKIGTPVSQSSKGELVLSVRNESFGKDDKRTRGPNTNRKLSFHTDRCDVISFLCLRAAKAGGESQIINSLQVSKIIEKEEPHLHEILKQNFPYKKHVVDKGNPKPFIMQPILSEKEGFFACSYLRVLIDRAHEDENCPRLSQKQIDAIDFLDQVCERPELQTKLTMKRGEILFLNNWTLLHRRTAFTDYNELTKRRHLLRIWLSMPNSRPLVDAFKENFGSTKAGKIRGGMKAEP